MSAFAITAADEEKLRGLRRMKLVALGALFLAALVYAVAFVAERNGVSWAGYLRAAGEAGHGRRARGLVRGDGAVPAAVGPAHPAHRDHPRPQGRDRAKPRGFRGDELLVRGGRPDPAAGAWTSRRGSGRGCRTTPMRGGSVAELAVGIRSAVGLLDDEQVRTAVSDFLRKRAEEFPIAEPAGNLLGEVVSDRAHVPLIDLIASNLYDWLASNRERVVDVVERQAPGWSPKWADGMVAAKVHREAREVRPGRARRPAAPAAQVHR